MKTIYPEETLALLAKYDELMKKIRQEYLKPLDDLLPSDPDEREYMLTKPWFQKLLHEKTQRQQRALLSDSCYQMCIDMKVKIISRSTCTYLFGADDMKAMVIPLTNK